MVRGDGDVALGGCGSTSARRDSRQGCAFQSGIYMERAVLHLFSSIIFRSAIFAFSFCETTPNGLSFLSSRLFTLRHGKGPLCTYALSVKATSFSLAQTLFTLAVS
jgi:hypothetical protein